MKKLNARVRRALQVMPANVREAYEKAALGGKTIAGLLEEIRCASQAKKFARARSAALTTLVVIKLMFFLALGAEMLCDTGIGLLTVEVRRGMTMVNRQLAALGCGITLALLIWIILEVVERCARTTIRLDVRIQRAWQALHDFDREVRSMTLSGTSRTEMSPGDFDRLTVVNRLSYKALDVVAAEVRLSDMQKRIADIEAGGQSPMANVQLGELRAQAQERRVPLRHLRSELDRALETVNRFGYGLNKADIFACGMQLYHDPTD